MFEQYYCSATQYTTQAGQPYRLDPATLCTLGLDDLGGWARAGQPTSLGHPLADALGTVLMHAVGGGRGVPHDMARLGGVGITAHPRPCSFTGRLVLLGYQVGPAQGGLQSQLTFTEVDEAWNVVAVTEYTLPGYAFVHDFAITEHYIVVYQVWVCVFSSGCLLKLCTGNLACDGMYMYKSTCTCCYPVVYTPSHRTQWRWTCHASSLARQQPRAASPGHLTTRACTSFPAPQPQCTAARCCRSPLC